MVAPALPNPLQPIQVSTDGSFAIPPSKNICNYVLTANTAKTITFPAYTGDTNTITPNYVSFASNGIFYARWDGSAASIPTVDSAPGLGSELTPSIRRITNFASVSVIAPAGTIITASYFS